MGVGWVCVPTAPAARGRYRSIAALTRVLPARQLIPFWLAIGLTFATFGILIDVMANGRSTPLKLWLNIVLLATIPVGLVWARMNGRRRTFVVIAAIYPLYTLLVGRTLHDLPAT